MSAQALAPAGTAVRQRAQQVFDEARQRIFRSTDRLFAGLMVFQWLLGIGFALWISPRAWEGAVSRTHLHVWAALFLGGAIAVFPVALSLMRPGATSTRHAIAVGQMLTSALLIHLTGGRIETHFHIFGSLAFLALYRDWRVLLTATTVVLGDHFLRGFYWPQSIYGVLSSGPWRALEHGAWVLFEDVVLIGSTRQSLREMQGIAERQAGLETLNARIESEVVRRTAELQESEASLTATGDHFRALVEHSSDGIFLLAKDATVLYASDSALRMLGRSASEVDGKDVFMAVHREDLEYAKTRFADCLASPGLEVTAEFRVRHADGGWRFIDAVCVNRFSEQAVGAVVTNFRDVTVRKGAEEALHRSEEQLRHAQRLEAVGRLAGGVAHDFNNVLNVIMGYGEMVKRRLSAEDPLQDKVEQILKATDRAATLTRQLLAFSRKQVLQPKALDLNSVVGDLDSMLRQLIGESIELKVSLQEQLGTVLADPGQMDQLIINLAANARDSMAGGGSIVIETGDVFLDESYTQRHAGARRGPHVTLAVSDTGHGMDEGTLSRIFEPFFTTKPLGKGTGLGLSTVYGIVEQSGGHIQVHSEKGLGTTFKVYLPRVEGRASEPAVEAATEPRGADSATILLVEDERALRVLLRETLEHYGYRVLDSATPGEALRLARSYEGPIDVVLTDVVMPEMSGRELALQLKALRPAAPVVYMSGYTDDAIGHHRLLDPGTLFLQKPFPPSRLISMVRAALAKARAA